MPNYDFECQECGVKVEAFLSVKDLDEGKTVACEKFGKDMKKVFSVPTFHLKGTGFVRNDITKKYP